MPRTPDPVHPGTRAPSQTPTSPVILTKQGTALTGGISLTAGSPAARVPPSDSSLPSASAGLLSSGQNIDEPAQRRAWWEAAA